MRAINNFIITLVWAVFTCFATVFTVVVLPFLFLVRFRLFMISEDERVEQIADVYLHQMKINTDYVRRFWK